MHALSYQRYNKLSLDLCTMQQNVIPNRLWHDARAIARARGITRANKGKGGLGGR